MDARIAYEFGEQESARALRASSATACHESRMTRPGPIRAGQALEPDTFMVSDVVPSPNFNERVGGPPDLILLHYTGMQTGEAALARLTAADSKVSSHYVVFEDGRIVQCVAEDKRAWHAGVSHWAGETDINSRSIGIEIVNPGHEFGYPDFPLRQIAAVIAICKSIMARRGAINPERVLAHSDVAPSRKQDPGEKFPWELLSESGVGHWVRAAPLNVPGPTLAPGDEGEQVLRLQRMLKNYGYGIDETGTYDDMTRDVVTAFQRHFRQAKVDGIADPSTLLTLRALIDARPARSPQEKEPKSQ
jgi:N-acetylmuramoyl-L-alanine amidase